MGEGERRTHTLGTGLQAEPLLVCLIQGKLAVNGRPFPVRFVRRANPLDLVSSLASMDERDGTSGFQHQIFCGSAVRITETPEAVDAFRKRFGSNRRLELRTCEHFGNTIPPSSCRFMQKSEPCEFITNISKATAFLDT